MLRSLDALRDTRREWRINRSRLIVAGLGVGLLLSILVYRYYSCRLPNTQTSSRNQIETASESR